MSFAPSGFQVDIEFTAGTWTNVTSKVRTSPGVSLRFGRTSPTGSPQVASCSLTLDNSTGDFTARNAASAYYPNVAPGKRVRVSYNSGTSPRFVGYIKAWHPSLEGGVTPVVSVTAVDRLEQLARRTLRSALEQEILADIPTAYYTLAGATDATSAGDSSVFTSAPILTSEQVGSGGTVAFGTGTGPGFDGLSAVVFTPVDVNNGVILSGSSVAHDGLVAGVAFVADAWLEACVATSTAAAQVIAKTLDAYGSFLSLEVSASGKLLAIASESFGVGVLGSVTSANNVATGQTRHVAATITLSGTTATLTAYMDGVSVGTATWTQASGLLYWYQTVQVGGAPYGYCLTGTVSHVAMSPGIVSGTRIAAHSAAALTGFTGESSGARATRILGYAGLSASDYTVATGAETVGPAVLSGKSVASALNELADTESGGSIAYVDVDGKVRFNSRTQRATATAAITIDANIDIAPGTWSPFVDAATQVDLSTVTRNRGGSATYTDGSATPVTDSVTSYANTDDNIANVAAWRVVSSSQTVRFPQLTVNLARVTNSATLYAALPSVTIGSRMAITNIPSTLNGIRIFHTTQLDCYVEGWSEQIGAFDHTITFDLSPAEKRHILEDATWGRLVETAGSMTLNGAVTSSATSISVATSGTEPTFTLVAGSYPLYIQIDEEVLSITAAPAGAASPQTLTVTRGALGTFADAHANGAAVSVYTGALTV